MPRPRPPHETSSSLLERDALRAEAAGLCARAAAGAGGMLAFEGVPGAGKSSLLAAVAEAAEGLCVRHACPLAVERDFPFATARRLLVGPAEPGEVSVPALIDALAVAAARRPMLLIVDDAHWADAASLTWLRCLASRTADLAAAVVLAVRPGEPAALLAHERVTVRTVPPLSRDAVATLLARSHRADVGCAWWATGGNPLLVREFLACSRPVEPGAPMRTTSCLRRIVAARIGRCGAGAARLADATAVLGGMSVAFEHAIGLAGLGRDRAVGAADGLVAEGILADRAALTFASPLVREAVYQAIPAVRRSELHLAAARRLLEARAPDELVAAQLLPAELSGQAWAVDPLRRVARAAMERSLPDPAMRMLRKALEVPPAGERPAVLRELGAAEAAAGEPAAEDHLRAALGSMRGAGAAEVALELGRLLIRAGRGVEARQVLRPVLAGPAAPELRLRAEAEELAAARAEPSSEPVRPTPRRRADPRGDTPGERLRLAALASEAGAAGAEREAVQALAGRALLGDRLLLEEGAGSASFASAVASLVHAGCFDAALAHLEAALDDTRRRGGPGAYALARAWRADVGWRRGHLAEAESDALDALSLASEHRVRIVVPLAAFPLTAVRVEQGRLDEAEDGLASCGFDDAIPPAALFAGVMYARARLNAARGGHERAAADLLAAGRALVAGGIRTPGVLPWRSDAALALAVLGRREEAQRLAADELRLARRLAAPHALGPAARAVALLGPCEQRVAGLEQAVAHLRPAGTPVLLAVALADLGKARARSRGREAGRADLREALDLAAAHGATAVADHARRELLVAGARPRRERIAGRDALTPAERRVAELAALRRSNRDIAGELFLTVKTVETHLSRAYAKLSIAGRHELGPVLAAET